MEEARSLASSAYSEWRGFLELVQLIEARMLILSLSEYESLSKVFMDVWKRYRKEKVELEAKK